MATNKKFREIKIEVERVRIISNLKKPRTDCEYCQSKVDFLTLSEATKTFAVNQLTIFQLAEKNVIHLKPDSSNEVLVCLQSLLSALNNF